jgi:hypothetical protein
MYRHDNDALTVMDWQGPSRCGTSAVALKVRSGGAQSAGIVVEQPQSGVAVATEHAADDARAVAVVDRWATNSTGASHGLCRAANGAGPRREAERVSPFFLLSVMPASTLKGEAAATEGPEGGRVRPSVCVLVGKCHVASGTVRARDSHCPILPARKGSWGGNAVPPNMAEILVCALVEAITGEDIDRNATPALAAAA